MPASTEMVKNTGSREIRLENIIISGGDKDSSTSIDGPLITNTKGTVTFSNIEVEYITSSTSLLSGLFNYEGNNNFNNIEKSSSVGGGSIINLEITKDYVISNSEYKYIIFDLLVI